MSFKPIDNDLKNLLNHCHPCPGFLNVCSSMKYMPELGHVPRGFYGATSGIHNVKLILVFAEPGDPLKGANYNSVESTTEHTYENHLRGKSQFHSNVQSILNGCFPGKTFDQIMEKTWITESVLCSAQKEGAGISRAIELECGNRYLINQIKMMPNALVVALGSKAGDRMRRLKIKFIQAFAASPPGCNFQGARESYLNVIKEFHNRN